MLHAKRTIHDAGRRGAVALEYILIAALVAIALIGGFIYFRNTLKSSTGAITETTAAAVQDSIKQSSTHEVTGSNVVTVNPNKEF